MDARRASARGRGRWRYGGVVVSEREELLPCPFCGGTPIMVSGGPGNYYVACKTCSATSVDGAAERAKSRWNQRAAADAILSRRPADDDPTAEAISEAYRRDIAAADDDALVAMDAGTAMLSASGEFVANGQMGDYWSHLACAALSVYRAHDPLLREAREALEDAETFIAWIAMEPGSRPSGSEAALSRVRVVLRKLEGQS